MGVDSVVVLARPWVADSVVVLARPWVADPVVVLAGPWLIDPVVVLARPVQCSLTRTSPYARVWQLRERVQLGRRVVASLRNVWVGRGSVD